MNPNGTPAPSDNFIHRVRIEDSIRSEVYNVPVPALCGAVDFWGNGDLGAEPAYPVVEVRCPMCAALQAFEDAEAREESESN